MNRDNEAYNRCVVSLLVGTMVFLTLSLCSCGSKTKDAALVSDNVYTQIQTYQADIVIVELLSSLETTITEPGVITVYAEADGYVILWGNRDTSFISRLTSDYKVIETFTLTGIVSGIGIWLLESDGGWIVFSSKTDELWHMQYYATRITNDCENITESFCIEQLRDSMVLGVELVGDFLTVVADNSIIVFDQDFIHIKTIEVQGLVMDIAAASNGQLYAAINEENGGNCNISIAEIDVKVGNTKSITQINGLENTQVVTLFGKSSGFIDRLCLSTTNGVYIYSLSNFTVQQKVVINPGRIGVQNAYEVFQINEDQMFIWGEYCITSGSNETKMLINVEFLSEVPTKEILTLGVLAPDDSENIRGICEYVNTQALSYSIELVSYIDQDDLEKNYDIAMKDGHQRLLLDILSGKSPDLVFVSPEDRKILTDQSALLLLDPYIKGSEEICNEGFLDKIWEASEVGGSHYWVTPFVSLCGIAATEVNAAKVGNGSVKDLRLLTEGNSDPLCQYGSCMDFFYPTIQNQYIGSQKGEVKINSEEFLSLISLMKDIKTEEISPLATDLEEPILWKSELQSFRSYIELSQTRSIPVTLMGYPEMMKDGPSINADSAVAISAQSDHIREAWLFIEYILSDNIQNMYASLGNGDIPISKTAFENMIVNDANEYERQRSEGTDFHNNISTYIGEGVNVSLGTASYPIVVDDEMMQNYRDIVSMATYYYSDDMSIYQLVSEELDFYLDGDKTSKEVIEILDSRLFVLVNE